MTEKNFLHDPGIVSTGKGRVGREEKNVYKTGLLLYKVAIKNIEFTGINSK